MKLGFNLFKMKNYFSNKDPIPDDMKSFLININVLVLAVLLATVGKL